MKSQIILIGCILLTLFTACNGDDDVTYQLNTKLVELNCNRTQVLEVTPVLQGLTYTSLNTNIATVSPEGLVKAKLVGTTKVVVKDSLNRFVDTVKVVVRSANTLFPNPYLGFGANQATLLKALNTTDFRYGYIQKGTLLIIEIDGYQWDYFMDEEGKMIYPSYVVGRSESTMLEAHLSDHYLFINTKSYNDIRVAEVTYTDSYYVNPDSTLIILHGSDSFNTTTTIEFHPATKEKIQRILSDENGDLLH